MRYDIENKSNKHKEKRVTKGNRKDISLTKINATITPKTSKKTKKHKDKEENAKKKHEQGKTKKGKTKKTQQKT